MNHIDIDNIGVGQYQRHIGIGDIGIVTIEFILENIDQKKCPKMPKNGQKLPKFAKICHKMSKNGQKGPKFCQNIENYRQVIQKLPFFCCIGVVLVFKENCSML